MNTQHSITAALTRLPATRTNAKRAAVRDLVSRMATDQVPTPDDLTLIETLLSERLLRDVDEFLELVKAYKAFPAKQASAENARLAVDAIEPEASVRERIRALDAAFAPVHSKFAAEKRALLDVIRARQTAREAYEAERAGLAMFSSRVNGQSEVFSLVFGD